MAIQIENFISGRMGNVVFYQRGGKSFARAAAVKVKQAPATREWSKVFGKAASAGKNLRMLLREILPETADKQMQNDFSAVLARALKLLLANGMAPMSAIPELGAFNFNKKTGIKERFRVAVAVRQLTDTELQVHIPAFVPATQLVAPAHTSRVDIHICAASCTLPDGQGSGSASFLLPFPYNDQPVPAQSITLTVPTTTGNLVLTGMRIRYWLSNGKEVTKEAFMPSSIVDAGFY